MLYHKDKQSYGLEKCIWKYSEEWKEIFFNVMQVKIALLSNSERMKFKEVDIEGIVLDTVNEAISVFDKFLINTKGYKKYSVIDSYDGTDTTLEQDIDYKILLAPFDGFFDKIEVR